MLVALAGLGCEKRNVADSAVTAKVKSKLAMDPDTSALKVDVDTDGGVVTLTGAVDTQAEKAQAGQIAENTEGVTRVINNIVVAPNATGDSGPGKPGEKAGEAVEKVEEGARDLGVTAEDLTILSKIKARYISEGITDADVDVKNGMVTLKGNVGSLQDKARAESIARATGGVRNVNNMLVVKP